jgi:dihydrofolate reductase
MGKIVVMMSVSVDGFMEGPGADLSWHQVDEELHQHFNDVLAGMSAFLDGRVTHEMMAEYWPTADQEPDSTPPEVEFARIWRDMPKRVYSRTLAPGPAAWNSTVVAEVVPAEVRALKAESSGDLALGGAALAASFMAHGLVDEFRLYVQPVVLREGTPLFPLGARVDLRLVESRVFGNGVVLLRYQRS